MTITAHSPEFLVISGVVCILAVVGLYFQKVIDNMRAVLLICGLVWLYAPPASAEDNGIVANDFMCGLYRVQLNDYVGLVINGKQYGAYKTTMLDKENNYVHQFGDRAELRVTQHGRVAFRIAGETRWASCKPLVLYAEASK